MLAVVAPLVTVVATVTEVPGIAGAACTMCAGGEFHPIAPVRIFDTRPATATDPDLPINDVVPYGAKPINLSTLSTGKIGRAHV